MRLLRCRWQRLAWRWRNRGPREPHPDPHRAPASAIYPSPREPRASRSSPSTWPSMLSS